MLVRLPWAHREVGLQQAFPQFRVPVPLTTTYGAPRISPPHAQIWRPAWNHAAGPDRVRPASDEQVKVLLVPAQTFRTVTGRRDVTAAIALPTRLT